MSVFANAQITQMEYFIDTDPGFGSAIAIPITPGNEVNTTFSPNVSGLAQGFHTLGLRTKLASGTWSATRTQSIIVSHFAAGEELSAMEYFIDSDPGIGSAKAISITPGPTVNAAFQPDVSSLAQGFHTLGIRSKTASGNWSATRTQSIVVSNFTANETISELEYFIDMDPGIGSATAITITPGSNVNAAFQPDVSGLSQGFHTLGIRSKTASGNWSATRTQSIVVSNFTANETISELEYFIDTDPGLGSATAITITPGSTVNAIFQANVSGLSQGFHTLGIRSKTASGSWSATRTQSIVVTNFTANETISELEYFIDTDPGLGSATAITITPGSTVNTTFQANISGLSQGFHTLGIRSKTAAGNWSATRTQSIVVSNFTANETISELEYFIDSDPGLGSATAITITPGSNVNATFKPDVSGFAQGFHTLGIRSKTTLGNWSSTRTESFFVMAPVQAQKIVRAEYYIDSDPGFGNGTEVLNTETGDLNTLIPINMNALNVGMHKLFIRVQDETGHWSVTRIEEFCISVKAAFSVPSEVCLGASFELIDQTTGTITATTYQWDFDSNKTIDNTTKGNVNHSFTEIGDYSITLIAGDASSCYDTISHTVSVLSNETPTISIIANKTELCHGEEVVFTASTQFEGSLPLYQWYIKGIEAGISTDNLVNSALNDKDEISCTLTSNYTCALVTQASSNVVTMTVNPVYNETATAAICMGETYIFGTQSLTTAGEYTETFTSISGCDSVVTISLNVNPTYSEQDAAIICQGETFVFGKQNLTDSGVYTEVFNSVSGCDSIVELSLTVNPVFATTDELSICENELPYNYYGNNIPVGTDSGEKTFTFSSISGCDSVVKLSLKVNPVYNNTATAIICEGELYEFGSQSLTVTGNYTETFTSVSGCDSVVNLTLQVNPIYSTNDALSICENELPYNYHGNNIAVGTLSGDINFNFISSSGCDSIATLSLSVNPVYNESANAEICQGDNYILGTQTLSTSGTYVETFNSQSGCDSTVTLSLTVNPVYSTTNYLSICENELPYSYYNEIIPIGTTSGDLVYNYTSISGCDSVVNLSLTVTTTYIGTASASICTGDSYNFGSQTLTTAGEYTETFNSAIGCDSTVTLNLQIVNSFEESIAAEICQGDNYILGTQTLSSSGSYVETFNSQSGCDSTVTLTLTVNPVYSTTDYLNICENELPYSYHNEIIPIGTTSDDMVYNYTSISGCDSTVTLTLTVNPVYSTTNYLSICENELPYSYYNEIIPIGTTSSDLVYNYTSISGCDSVVNLSLTVTAAYIGTTSASICAGDSYNFGSQTLTTAGEYTETFNSANGCDSTVTLNLQIVDSFEESITAEICQGDNYILGTQTLSSSGTYVEKFNSQSGCDSTVTLLLTVNPVYSTTNYLSICENELPYSYYNETIPIGTTSGDLVYNLYSVNGCDSTVTLSLTVNPVFNVTFKVTDGSNIIEDALVSLTNYGSIFTNTQGVALFENILPESEIAYSILAEGYNEATGNITVTSTNVTEDIIMLSTDLQDIQADNIEIYPNPAGNNITIKNANGAKILIYNTKGQIVNEISSALTNQIINVSALPEGVYYIKVNNINSKLLIIH